MEAITTFANRIWELSIKRTQQLHLDKWLGKSGWLGREALGVMYMFEDTVFLAFSPIPHNLPHYTKSPQRNVMD